MEKLKLFEDFDKDYVTTHFSDVEVGDMDKTMSMIKYQKENGGVIRIPEEQIDFFVEQGFDVRHITLSNLLSHEYEDALNGEKINYVVVIVDDEVELIKPNLK